MDKFNTKNYSNTYLYGMSPGYEKKLFEFIMKSDQIDKDVDSFDDIRYEVKKRQVTSSLVKVLNSKNIILLTGNEELPKAFKVFAAKDVKSDNKLKVFIDCTNLVIMQNGSYKCRDIDILIAYLVSAMTTLIYYLDPNRIILNDKINKSGSECFSLLFTHVIDYLEKISIIPSIKSKCLYLSSLYYQTNILGKDIDDRTKAASRKLSEISEREEDILFIQLDNNWNLNIKYFLDAISKVLRLNKLTLEVIVEKWIYLYGTGTHFGLELYPAFSSMITNAYVGCYINNQKTIEKVTGRELVNYSDAIFKIGADSIG